MSESRNETSEAGDPVLTDDEKSALLEGVESGAVEVQAAGGSRYANVRPFVIGPRARLTSNSLPRLEKINEQVAGRLAAGCEALLQADVRVEATSLARQSFADFRELWPARSVGIAFTAAPLPGRALVVVDPVLIGPLVESFFGGGSPESTAHNEAAHSAGSLSTVQLFAGELLSAIGETMKPVREIAPQRAATHVGLDTIDGIADADAVVACEFEVELGGAEPQRGSFSVVWPEAVLAPLRSALEGRPKDADAAAEARWAKAWRERLPEVVVSLSTRVGHARMTLGELVNLKPGDVIGIDTPRVARLLAGNIELLEGRFGVQAGRNAIETLGWITTPPARKS